MNVSKLTLLWPFWILGGLLVLRHAYQGLRSGEISPGRRSFWRMREGYYRATQPGRFWALVIFDLIVALFFIVMGMFLLLTT
jgi:hypothetical protein